MRIVVTGGAGFIGSHLTDIFLARGDTVIAIDDLSRGRPARLDPRVSCVKLSVTDGPELIAEFERIRPDLVCHLAAQIDVRLSVADPAADARANVVGTVNVLEAARRADARVIFASSGGALYGRDAPIPSGEDVLPLPESPYGVAKHCAEQYLGLYNRLHGTRHSAIRLANVYGPRQDPDGDAGVIAIFCSAALAGTPPTIFGDGTQTRDYVYVGDVARAFAAAADARRPGVWNIGTGREVSVLDLVAVIGEAAGRPVQPVFGEYRPGELQRSAVAAGLAEQDLGWSAQVSLPEGISRVYRWIESGAPDRAPA
ncbi:MAG: NAD-dependent epimerase/dehydratase family protein [Streptosporangiaceae bacterium]